MNSLEIITLNFNETRRRSIKIWLSIPEDKYHWKPDADAMSCIEIVRHILEGQYIYGQIIISRGGATDLMTPWQNKPYESIQQEIAFNLHYQSAFMAMLCDFSEKQLKEIEIIRTQLNQRRILGDYLLRITYHEAVHAGQLLSYLRLMNVKCPVIWD